MYVIHVHFVRRGSAGGGGGFRSPAPGNTAAVPVKPRPATRRNNRNKRLLLLLLTNKCQGRTQPSALTSPSSDVCMCVSALHCDWVRRILR